MKLFILLSNAFILTRVVYGFTNPISTINALQQHQRLSFRPIETHRFAAENDDENNLENDDDEASRLRKQAEQLREQIRNMEAQLGEKRKRSYSSSGEDGNVSEQVETSQQQQQPTLKGKTVLVAGANGRLGSMVCRYLLRNYPETQVVAAVHYVGENSPTARGYGRLSYEVGAEDGVGTIGPAWSSTDRTATFQYSADIMSGYNLRNLRLVECEFLDPVQCMSIAQGCDAMIWCATDFNGNKPRAISGLNAAFLFRAVTRPTKGRVEVEGLENMLSALKAAKQDRRWKTGVDTSSSDPTNVVLVSIAPDAYSDFETPFGSFKGIKKQGEQVLRENFPSLTNTILQFSRFEDNFVGEDLDIQIDSDIGESDEKARRRINRRDAARAAVDALLNNDIKGKTVQIWTQTR